MLQCTPLWWADSLGWYVMTFGWTSTFWMLWHFLLATQPLVVRRNGRWTPRASVKCILLAAKRELENMQSCMVMVLVTWCVLLLSFIAPLAHHHQSCLFFQVSFFLFHVSMGGSFHREACVHLSWGGSEGEMWSGGRAESLGTPASSGWKSTRSLAQKSVLVPSWSWLGPVY